MSKVNIKVQKAFDKLEKRLIVYPLLPQDMNMIKKAMQDMYDLGHADGYAECVVDDTEMQKHLCYEDY